MESLPSSYGLLRMVDPVRSSGVERPAPEAVTGPRCPMPFTPNWGQVAGAGLGGALGASRAAAFADLPIPACGH
jgi:hypothetical protein